MEHAYSIYGLRLEADQCLPGMLEAGNGPPADVTVWTQHVPTWVTGAIAGSKQLRFDSGDSHVGLPATVQVWRYFDSGAFHFAYRGGVEFVIDSRGRGISVACTESATVQDATSYLVGVILGFALRLRGRLALHASVVVIDDRAVVLLGDAGSGKSTTAAVFAAMGHEILSDDVCALVESGGEFWVEPAYPGIRLWPETVEAIFGSSDALPRIAPAWDKRLLALSGGDHRFHSTRLPVGALYWLTESQRAKSSSRVKELRASEQMMKLVSMSYPGYLLDRKMRSDEFDLLVRLAGNVPGSDVEVRNDIFSVSETCHEILADFRAPREQD